MTARELYSQAKARLAEAGVDSPGFDAARLAERFLGLDRPGLAMHGGEAPDEGKRREFLEAVSQRAARRPLQYILGEWPFMSLTLQVGEGVLIPREDTAALVEKFKALAESNATQVEVDEWGKRRLAYPIQDQNEGHYVRITFTAEPAFPAELDRIFRITDGVMRSIIVCLDE